MEDEPLARDLLRCYIALHADLDLVGEAGDGKTGLRLVNYLAPDLLLLDIHLPELDGLSLARQMQRTPAIIFITAYDQHAMTAFELGAFDYLLKPVLPARFQMALERVRERRKLNQAQEPLGNRLPDVLDTRFLQHFFVRHLGSLVPVHVPEIVRLEADDDYTAVHVGGRRLLVHVPLRDMASRLDPQSFVRVHRCHLVHLAHVRSIQPAGRRVVVRMSDGSQIAPSRAGMQALAALRL